VVVADAGMLSAANLLALEQAGFRFIVGSKTSKAPYDLTAHFQRYGNAFDDGQTIQTSRVMGTGKQTRAPGGWSGTTRSPATATTSKPSTP